MFVFCIIALSEQDVSGLRKPLWVPSQERVKQANVTKFIDVVNKRHAPIMTCTNGLLSAFQIFGRLCGILQTLKPRGSMIMSSTI